MTSLADFFWTEGLKLFGGDILFAAMAIIIMYFLLFRFLSLNAAASIVLFVVLLDGMLAPNYVRGAFSWSGAFAVDFLTPFLIGLYAVTIGLIVVFFFLKISNR